MQLRAALPRYGPARYVANGTVAVPGVRLDARPVRPPWAAMARMVRDLEFDLADLSPTTYIAARAQGVPVVALPITLEVQFPYRAVWCRTSAGIDSPERLDGKRIGVRTWSNPITVWLRGMLSEQFGVTLDNSSWLVTVSEPLPGLAVPAAVQTTNPDDEKLLTGTLSTDEIPATAQLLDLLATGALDAASDPAGMGWERALEQRRVDPGLLSPLFADHWEQSARWHEMSGVLPICHVLVARQSLVDANPEIVGALRTAFEEAKALFFSRPAPDRSATGVDAARDRDMHEFRGYIDADPLPNDHEPVSRSLSTVMRYMTEQRYLDAPLPVSGLVA